MMMVQHFHWKNDFESCSFFSFFAFFSSFFQYFFYFFFCVFFIYLLFAFFLILVLLFLFPLFFLPVPLNFSTSNYYFIIICLFLFLHLFRRRLPLLSSSPPPYSWGRKVILKYFCVSYVTEPGVSWSECRLFSSSSLPFFFLPLPFLSICPICSFQPLSVFAPVLCLLPTLNVYSFPCLSCSLVSTFFYCLTHSLSSIPPPSLTAHASGNNNV